jgi:hypothetical protein
MPTLANTPTLDVVRSALARLRAAHERASEWQKPKVHAKVAILNADVIDRTRGLTHNDEVTPGSRIAHQVEGLFVRRRR